MAGMRARPQAALPLGPHSQFLSKQILRRSLWGALDGCAVRCGKRRVDDIPGVARGRRLKHQDLGLFVGGRAVLDAARHDHAFAGAEIDHAIAELHAKAPPPHEEEFVLRRMMVPGKRALHLHDLDLLSIERGNYLRPPVLGKERELVVEIELDRHERLFVYSPPNVMSHTHRSDGSCSYYT